MMQSFLNEPLQIGTLTLKNRLIQGPLAGFSASPMRERFYAYQAPAYCVSEMLSAQDILHKHQPQNRYLHRSLKETVLAYQISGNNPEILAKAAKKLQVLGADLIDINCGCPKAKIRKKGAGSALLDTPKSLFHLIQTVREQIEIPLTVKIRIQGSDEDIELAQGIEASGADALIVHGRRWQDHYDCKANHQHIGRMKQSLSIPVIANGDLQDLDSLKEAYIDNQCDGFMISRAGTGRPWLYQALLEETFTPKSAEEQLEQFMLHLHGLCQLESAFKAVLQARSLVRYYFRALRTEAFLQKFYLLSDLHEIEQCLMHALTQMPPTINHQLLTCNKRTLC